MKKTLLGYVPEKSIIYNFHPFTRLFFIFSLTLIPLLVLNINCNLILIFLICLLFIFSKIDLKVLRFYAPIFLILFVFIFFIYTFFTDPYLKDRVLFSLLGVKFYAGGASYALKVYTRILTVLFLTIYFLHVMTETEIIVALRSIKIPFILCYTLGLALRAMGMFLNDYRTIREAEKARAIDLKELSIFKKIAKLINYVIPLLALAIRRTDEFSDAISSRGFSFKGMSKRPNYLAKKFFFKVYDYLFILFSIIFTGFFIYFFRK